MKTYEYQHCQLPATIEFYVSCQHIRTEPEIKSELIHRVTRFTQRTTSNERNTPHNFESTRTKKETTASTSRPEQSGGQIELAELRNWPLRG